MAGTKCPGSGDSINAFPGESDVCPVCQKWIKVRKDSTIGVHRLSRKQAATLYRARDAFGRLTWRTKYHPRPRRTA